MVKTCKTKNCYFEEWLSTLNNYIFTASNQSYMKPYKEEKEMLFCPFCASELEDVDIE